MYPENHIFCYTIRLLLVAGLLAWCVCLDAQCSSIPASAACSGTVLVNNANVSGGTYYYSGPATTIANVNMNSGTIRICGSLTISNINFNSGNIFIESGGSLTIGNGDFYINGNSSIVNRGTISFTGNVHMQNANNNFYNASSTSYLSVNGTFEINSSSSRLFNLGIVNVGKLQLQSNAPAGAVCQQENAIINVTDLVNNRTNSVSYSGISAGEACIKVSSTAQLNNALSNTAKTTICKGASVTVSGGGGWGSSTVTPNCSSCAVALPLYITNISATAVAAKVNVEWTTAASTTGTEIFYIERSANGTDFSTIHSIDADRGKKTYQFEDDQVISDKQYYRIRQVGPDGVPFYSAIAEATISIQSKVLVYPNPVKPQTSLNIVFSSPKPGQVVLVLTDLSGKISSQQIIAATAGVNHAAIEIGSRAAGIYLLKLQTPYGISYSRVCVLNQ